MKKNIILCIVFTALFSSCTDEFDKAPIMKDDNSSFDLSESEVLTIAESFQRSVTESSKTRTKDIAFDIKSVYRLGTPEKTRALSNEKTPLIYEIEMNDGVKSGKVIVSGDKRFPEVLAYIPSFNDSLYKVSREPNIMIQMAKNALLDKIQNYKMASLTRSYAKESIQGEVSVMIVPFCSTAWRQGSPYNQMLPKAWIEYAAGMGGKPGSSMYGNYNTGKAAVAIAQTMAYLQPRLMLDGTYIDWYSLTMEADVTEPDQKMAARLFKYIYDTIGTYPVWGKSYNDVWPHSPTTIVDAVVAMETSIGNIPRALNSAQCGLTFDNVQNWNLNVIRNSLTSLHPVFVGNQNREAFLVDGYATNEENAMYLHCNFGEYKGFNGYYLVYDDGSVVFESDNWFYRDTQLGIIANIRRASRI